MVVHVVSWVSCWIYQLSKYQSSCEICTHVWTALCLQMALHHAVQGHQQDQWLPSWGCVYVQGRHTADSRLALSQWESSIQSNTVSHWLGANFESALHSHCIHRHSHSAASWVGCAHSTADSTRSRWAATERSVRMAGSGPAHGDGCYRRGNPGCPFSCPLCNTVWDWVKDNTQRNNSFSNTSCFVTLEFFYFIPKHYYKW